MIPALSIAFLSCFGTPFANASTELDLERRERSRFAAYDLPVGDYVPGSGLIGEADYLASIMSANGASIASIRQAVAAAKGIFDVRRVRAGRPFLTLREPETDALRYLIYEENDRDYVVFDLGEPVRVYRGQKLMRLREVSVAGTIETSLYDALANQGRPTLLAGALADIFGRKVDFRRIRKGDRFRIIYEQQLAGETVVGIGRILAAWMAHDDEEHYAFLHDNPHESLYLDEHGIGIRTAFLRAPIKGGRITSDYTRSRFHPVQKRYKPHLGTDYAAPTGTPILAMSDGVVTEATRSRHNGNYVKIAHDGVYATQYLHMSAIAEGIAPDQRVVRGQVIGFVGETGLAVGPHVCLRFWKNGNQVDFRYHRHLGAEVGQMITDGEIVDLTEPLRDRLDGLSIATAVVTTAP